MIRDPNHGQSPIIVVGMHRSGTSMLSQLLCQMGVFMGADCHSEHAESHTFLTMNVRLLQSVGAAWSNPTPLLQAMDKAMFREHLIDRLQRGFKPRHVRRYLGTETRGTRKRFPDFWGWKDPRNTLTFPLWLRHFPQAKLR